MIRPLTQEEIRKVFPDAPADAKPSYEVINGNHCFKYYHVEGGTGWLAERCKDPTPITQ